MPDSPPSRHGYHQPSDCCVASCEICPSLVRVDAETLEVRNRLRELSKERRSLLNWINGHHDALTSRLPPEILSEIFKICVMTSGPSNANKAPLVISQVCKRWRDVSLHTSQLWTTVEITTNTHSDKPYDLELAAEWLSRSRSLPLSLSLALKRPELSSPAEDPITIIPIIDLLRAHSGRWRNLKIDPFCESYVVRRLLNNLDHVPANLGTLEICSSDQKIVYSGLYDMGSVLLPTHLRVYNKASTFGLALEWDRLVSLDISESLHFDELVDIIVRAPNLESCNVHWDVLRDCGIYGLPDTPKTCSALKSLSTVSSYVAHGDNILTYLTLPSLKTLQYVYHCRSPGDDDLYILFCFLERSSPQLDDFVFSIKPRGVSQYVNLWPYERPIDIRSLEFDTSQMNTLDDAEQVPTTNNFLSLLSRTLSRGVLPKLREVVLNIPLAFSIWSAIYKLLKDHGEFLKSVVILYHPFRAGARPQVSMHPSVHSGFVELEKHGIVVTLKHGDASCPLSKTFLATSQDDM